MIFLSQLLLLVISIPLNGLVFVTILTNKRLFPSTRFVLNLCASNFVASTVGALALALPAIQEISHFLNVIVTFSSLITVTLISAERYVTIAYPMQHLVTQFRSILAICVTWLFSALLVIPAALLFKETGCRIYFGLLNLSMALASLTLMTLLYSHIFKIAREKCRKVRLGEFKPERVSISSDWASSVLQHTVTPGPGARNVTILSTNRQKIFCSTSSLCWPTPINNYSNSPRKTILTILSLIGAVVVCNLPPPLALLFIPSIFRGVQSTLFPLSAALHPLLYGLLNRNIRRRIMQRRPTVLVPSFHRQGRCQLRAPSVPLLLLMTEVEPQPQTVRKPSQDSGADMSFSEDEEAHPLTIISKSDSNICFLKKFPHLRLNVSNAAMSQSADASINLMAFSSS